MYSILVFSKNILLLNADGVAINSFFNQIMRGQHVAVEDKLGQPQVKWIINLKKKKKSREVSIAKPIGKTFVPLKRNNLFFYTINQGIELLVLFDSDDERTLNISSRACAWKLDFNPKKKKKEKEEWTHFHDNRQRPLMNIKGHGLSNALLVSF